MNQIAQRNLKEGENKELLKRNIRKHPNIVIVVDNDDNAKLNYQRKGAKYIQMRAH